MMYGIQLEPDDNGTFFVTCAAFPEVKTFGDNREDAIAHARDAIEEAIAARIADSDDIPLSDHDTPHVVVARLHLQTELKTRLYIAVRRAGVNRAELARRLGWHREQVDRLFKLGHASRLDQIEAAFAAIGRTVEVDDFELA